MTIPSNQDYRDYSSYISINSASNNLKQNNQEEVFMNTEKVKVEEPTKIEKERQISKEEAAVLMAQYQATQIFKNQIDTYFDDHEEESEELTFKDVREVNKLLNRAEMLRYYDEDKARIEEKESSFHLWA